MSRASRLKVTGAVSVRFTNSPITRVHEKPTSSGRAGGSGLYGEWVMGIKEKYTFKLLFGIIFVAAIAYFGYWLLAVYKVENVFGMIAIGLFVILPLIKVIFTLPRELRLLILVWSSDNPEEIVEGTDKLREKGVL